MNLQGGQNLRMDPSQQDRFQSRIVPLMQATAQLLSLTLEST